MAYLIADSGSTTCDWCLIDGSKKKKFTTTGISPYFFTDEQLNDLLKTQVLKKLAKATVTKIFFYGTGLSNPNNQKLIIGCLKNVFPSAKVKVDTDILAASHALLQQQKGMVCILGTGSNAAFYNGKKIAKNSAGLGYVLGDEGSGSYLGKKVLQYYLYNTFDEELHAAFEQQFTTNKTEILNCVYKQPFANKYIASYASFLSNNRGHYMVENIIEDGLHDFFFNHIYKFRESWQYSINFTGSVAFAFKDVLKEICNLYELQLGNIIQKPIDGLIKYHQAY